MAICGWCAREMAAANSCAVDAFHVDGRRVAMIAYGAEPGRGAFLLRWHLV